MANLSPKQTPARPGSFTQGAVQASDAPGFHLACCWQGRVIMPGGHGRGRSGHGGGGVGCRHNHARTRLAGRKGRKNRNNNGSFLLPGLGAKEHFPPDLVLVPKHMGKSIYVNVPSIVSYILHV